DQLVSAVAFLRFTAFTADAVANTLTLSDPVTGPLTLVVEYPTTDGKTLSQKFELTASSSRTLTLRGDLSSSAGVAVSTPKALVRGTDFTMSGSSVTLVGSTASALGQLVKVVVNYPLEARSYIGGEPVFEAVPNAQGGFDLRDVTYAGAEKIFDVFTDQAVLDPFAAQLVHAAGEPALHVAGDPLLHSRGDLQRYLGGEPT